MANLTRLISSPIRPLPFLRWSRSSSTGCTEVKVKSIKICPKIYHEYKISFLGSSFGKQHEAANRRILAR